MEMTVLPGRALTYSRSTKKVPRSRGGRPAEPPDSSPDSIAQAAAVTRVRSRRPASGSVGGGRPWSEDAVCGAQRCRSAEEGKIMTLHNVGNDTFVIYIN